MCCIDSARSGPKYARRRSGRVPKECQARATEERNAGCRTACREVRPTPPCLAGSRAHRKAKCREAGVGSETWRRPWKEQSIANFEVSSPMSSVPR